MLSPRASHQRASTTPLLHDRGGETTSSLRALFFADSPLWDGESCVFSICCEFNNPPWFTKTLPSTTSDNIELRICIHQVTGTENTPIELIELYVQ